MHETIVTISTEILGTERTSNGQGGGGGILVQEEARGIVGEESRLVGYMKKREFLDQTAGCTYLAWLIKSPAMFNIAGDLIFQRRTLFDGAELYLAAQNFI